MQYLQSYGCVWRLTNMAYKKFLKDVSAGIHWDLDTYGDRVVTELRPVIDITPEQAAADLKYFLENGN